MTLAISKVSEQAKNDIATLMGWVASNKVDNFEFSIRRDVVDDIPIYDIEISWIDTIMFQIESLGDCSIILRFIIGWSKDMKYNSICIDRDGFFEIEVY